MGSRDITIVFNSGRGIHIVNCLSTDIKPTNVVPGSELYYTDDSSVVYGFFGGAWISIKSNGAGHVAVKSKDNEPQSWYTPFDKTSPALTNGTVIHNSGDVSIYDLMEFTLNVAPAGGELSVYASQNGVDFFGPIHVVTRSVSVGSGSQSITAITALGAYYVMGRFKELEIRQATANATVLPQVIGSHSAGKAR